jgi:2',3'-cyclic-nucleotide 2'-phosphodiesterase (5'-nucleotidase family)
MMPPTSSPEIRLRKIFQLLVIVFVSLCSISAAADDPVMLTVLHTNDTHGRLLPFSYPERVSPGSESAALTQRTNIGGIARRAALAQRIRSEQKARNGTVWLVDAGDFYGGTPFSIEYKGEAEIAAMNAAGYDFATLGNHEFNNSPAHLKKLLAQARFEFLCANAVEKHGGKTLVPSYTIRSVGPVKVALFGLVTRDARSYPAARESIEILDEIQTARRMAAELKSQADILILISHCGEKVDHAIAEAVKTIDVIVGGHSHSRLPAGKLVKHSDALNAGAFNGTLIVQNHQWGGELGRLDLLFSRDSQGVWNVDHYRAQLLPVTSEIKEDPATAAVVERFWRPIAEHYEAVVGHAAADFISLYHDRAEYNLMADAIAEAFATDFALENIGGVRAPLIKGPITRADLVAMDPFDNTIVTFTIDGAHLKHLLLRERPAVSGLRYRIQAGRLVEATCAGLPISDGKMYTGAINSFYAKMLPKTVAQHDTGRKRLQVLLEHIRKKGTVTPVYDGRRIIVQR